MGNVLGHQAKADYIRKVKATPCADCGIRYPYWVMDLDHRPGTVKLFTVADKYVSYGMATVKAEVAKCDVVCANCHRQRTHTRSGILEI
jgi:hypothetical protein